MKKILLYTTLFLGLASSAIAQEKLWTMEECMQYAVDNSPTVRKQIHTHDTYKAEYNSSIGSFFPSLTAGVSGQYNFGRALDPETNIYTNTTTFNNYYEGYASLPIFNGGQLVNQFRLAKSNRQMGMNDIQKAKDDLALNTLEAYVNVVYYQGTVQYASEKLEESKRVLYKAKREEELGLKGKADVAQIEAQTAGDDYNLTRQQNLYTTALLKLKEYMNYPYDEELKIDTTALVTDYLFEFESIDDIFTSAQESNPTALQAEYQLKASKLNLLIQKGKLFPTISVSAGIYTSYYENLKSETAPVAFRSQFKNNRGEYISFNLRLPLFNGLSKLTEVRRARNNMRIAQEQQTEVLRQLQTAIEQSVADREGFAKESIQMEKKLKSDEIAYQVTVRKFEEGLMSPLDLQTSSNTLIESKANLLQRRLMYLLKCKQVDYYKGQPLINR
ncbi:outer membrane protein [Parabacteroides sp. PF5-5]|uniref:TolC family protein n=1 Tax=unclassified Parabacteroides TaxID=2649774 RepID=UPI0024769527|nr:MULTISPECIES: TolC family protein [unclassified Parabacteroides]MDH6306497.1 outer membrane protein [Parabacteroides sp. PH5-39]MDH6317464.1 outer membrane protein [Parabacteroides sp. PF5-13]MDH6321233.1 outer membrane protein [Parabacteroides sp. PH5-13]MDH6324965.1 outer membrane protein [Parabacteroides sp. PH5-8]MDH6328674.1 outer membrane protein [Parabacteroides sp. PH5-41]